MRLLDNVFDDEDEKNTINKQVGVKAEKIVYSLIVDIFKPDDVNSMEAIIKGLILITN